ncbi:hypothetical protein [Micromonospora lupini]|uniref:Uncharacterized protein n=1 Tax=Micromonospora lupini str. Lupac 08 TaxID=1150864 RepID=I0L1S4_9ACTN|nr:hypothetical protein [Micromonospora lupini]CCH17771.1 conserved hypothetical protein [Micromonospora lupini str. Lupac 08]
MALAADIGATPADDTETLAYTYLHTQSWTRATNVITRTDLRRWRHDDGSGREVTRQPPNVRGLTHRPNAKERDLFAVATVHARRCAPGELRPYLPDPLPTEPSALTNALAPRELADEPAYPRMVVHGIVGLTTGQYLNQEQRAATLRVLANVPHIAYQGFATDIAGRVGLGFMVTADGSTLELVIHPRTGEVLAAHEQVAGARPGLFSYVLILERGHTTDTATVLVHP